MMTKDTTVKEVEVRKLLVLPAALDKNHPLHTGYVERGKDNES